MRKSNRKFAWLLAFTVFANLFIGIGSSSATTTNIVVGAVPAISAVVTNQSLASLQIDEAAVGNLQTLSGASQILLTLPPGVNFNTAFYAGGLSLTVGTANIGGIPGYTATATRQSNQVLSVLLAPNGKIENSPAVVTIPMQVDITQLGSGDLNVNVLGSGNAVQSGNYVIGRFVNAGAIVSVLPTLSSGNTGSAYGTIRIIENAAHSLALGKTITLTLPAGFEWNGTAIATPITGGLELGSNPVPQTLVAGSVPYDNNTANNIDPRTATFTIGAESSSPAIVNIKTNIIVGPGANPANLLVMVNGTAITSNNVTVGANANYGVNVAADMAPTINAGQPDQKIANLTITEDVAGSLIGGRTLTVALPEDVIFQALPTLTLIAGDNIAQDVATAWVSNGDQTQVSFTLGKSSVNPATIRIQDLYVITAPDVSGDIKLTVGGTAGAGGTIVAASAVPSPNQTAGIVTASFIIGSNRYTLNGVEKSMDEVPYIEDDRAFLPLRFLAYSLGINDHSIFWNEQSQTITLLKGDKIVQLKIGSDSVLINNMSKNIDAAPKIVGGRTMVPAAWVAQVFGASASWDQKNQAVTIGPVSAQ